MSDFLPLPHFTTKQLRRGINRHMGRFSRQTKRSRRRATAAGGRLFNRYMRERVLDKQSPFGQRGADDGSDFSGGPYAVVRKTLDRMDHPYSRRHGQSRLGPLGWPWYGIYKKTGALLAAYEGKQGRDGSYVARFRPGAKLAAVTGNDVMWGRNPIHWAAADPFIQEQVFDAMVKKSTRDLRMDWGS